MDGQSASDLASRLFIPLKNVVAKYGDLEDKRLREELSKVLDFLHKQSKTTSLFLVS